MTKIFSVLVLLSVCTLPACTYIDSIFNKDASSQNTDQNTLNQGYAKFEKESMTKSLNKYQKYYAEGEIVANDNYRFMVPTNFSAVDIVVHEGTSSDGDLMTAHSLDGMALVSIQKYQGKRGPEIGCDSVVEYQKNNPEVKFLKKPYFVKTSTGSGCELFLHYTKNDGLQYVSYSFTEQFDSMHMYEVSATLQYPASYENYILFITEFFKNTYSPEVQLILKHMNKEYAKGEKILKKKEYNVRLN
ncbi:hypothetical protein SAMN02745213_01777 [Succinivibrio dextrinosolvens DSM 3072]|uniref:Lipoprotein n=1 Tax=Succinivibrio dextrinosolvens DSM 3072 TaxID=1123324 RepID=A0A1T4VMW9_9GAMM|nr:hypothetical protein [Succinivibrio dextrinosolvens]SKA66208.1 hypothetical protein SAMN02745213_01777 [Succinivibrio dextrinosolvens DSM 3072]